MSLIQQLLQDFQKVDQLVLDAERGMEQFVEAWQGPWQALEAASLEGSSSSRTAVESARQLSDELGRLGSETRGHEEQLTLQMEKVSAQLDSDFAELRTQARSLTSHLTDEKAALIQRQARCELVAREIETALQQGVADSENQTQGLQQQTEPALGGLRELEANLRSDYDPEEFAALEARLRSLQRQLSEHADARVPGLVSELVEFLESQLSPGLHQDVAAFGATSEEHFRQHLAQSEKAGEAWRLDWEGLLTASQKLLGQELPQELAGELNARTVPAISQSLEQGTRSWHTFGNTSAYLNREQDPYLPAVRELHLALQQMLGR